MKLYVCPQQNILCNNVTRNPNQIKNLWMSLKKSRIGCDTIPAEFYFPDDVWKIILQLSPIETWHNLMLSCKKLHHLGLTVFLKKIQTIAKLSKLTNEDAKIASLFEFQNLYRLIEKGAYTIIVA